MLGMLQDIAQKGWPDWRYRKIHGTENGDRENGEAAKTILAEHRQQAKVGMRPDPKNLSVGLHRLRRIINIRGATERQFTVAQEEIRLELQTQGEAF